METEDLNKLAIQVNRLSTVCAMVCLILTVYFITPQLADNTYRPLWNVQLPIPVWLLLWGLFASTLTLKFVLVPHILALAQEEEVQAKFEKASEERSVKVTKLRRHRSV